MLSIPQLWLPYNRVNSKEYYSFCLLPIHLNHLVCLTPVQSRSSLNACIPFKLCNVLMDCLVTTEVRWCTLNVFEAPFALVPRMLHDCNHLPCCCPLVFSVASFKNNVLAALCVSFDLCWNISLEIPPFIVHKISSKLIKYKVYWEFRLISVDTRTNARKIYHCPDFEFRFVKDVPVRTRAVLLLELITCMYL